jgi:mannose-6-phosphate isomerase-like protein (cupin superfamily)
MLTARKTALASSCSYSNDAAEQNEAAVSTFASWRRTTKIPRCACGRLIVSPWAGQEHDMPFLDTKGLRVIERLPGWKGRFFHTATMTFADYEFTAGSTIHEHFHPEEEVYEVIAGELEMAVDGVTDIVRPGIVAIVPSNARHSVRALTDGRVIIVDHPTRPEFG